MAEQRSQYNVQIQKTAERDQDKASPQPQRLDQERIFEAQPLKQPNVYEQPKQKRKARRVPRTRQDPAYRLLCAIFGFIQGFFVVIPTTFILSTFNTAIATIRAPRTFFHTAFAILKSEVLSDTTKVVLLLCLPFVTIAWPFIAFCNSIACGVLLGLIGPVFHVVAGKHILFGGFFAVIGQALQLVRHFWLLHGLSTEEIMTLIHLVVNILTDVRMLFTQFWQSRPEDKMDTIKKSPPLQALLRGYDYFLASAFPERQM